VPRSLLSDWRIHALLALAVVAAAAAASRSCGSASPQVGRGALPAPNEPIARNPRRLAEQLGTTTIALRDAIDRWRTAGNPRRGAPPRDVTLLALFQQRVYLLLTARPRLAGRTLARLPRSVRAEARDTYAARRALARLAAPPRRRKFRTGRALPAGVLLDLYRKAQRRFGVEWQVLAAVNFVETGFNRLRSNSTAGAQGPMQFIPSTWRAYGGGGDIRDPHDAIIGAARYLRASGAPQSYRRALYAYNPSPLYVDAVLRYARRIRRDVRSYYAYYSWQVFVRTPSGTRRLTGPGRRAQAFMPCGRTAPALACAASAQAAASEGAGRASV
jgi:membrane-bound lytic murein transglycosylase B